MLRSTPSRAHTGYDDKKMRLSCSTWLARFRQPHPGPDQEPAQAHDPVKMGLALCRAPADPCIARTELQRRRRKTPGRRGRRDPRPPDTASGNRQTSPCLEDVQNAAACSTTCAARPSPPELATALPQPEPPPGPSTPQQPDPPDGAAREAVPERGTQAAGSGPTAPQHRAPSGNPKDEASLAHRENQTPRTPAAQSLSGRRSAPDAESLPDAAPNPASEACQESGSGSSCDVIYIANFNLFSPTCGYWVGLALRQILSPGLFQSSELHVDQIVRRGETSTWLLARLREIKREEWRIVPYLDTGREEKRDVNALKNELNLTKRGSPPKPDRKPGMAARAGSSGNGLRRRRVGERNPGRLSGA